MQAPKEAELFRFAQGRLETAKKAMQRLLERAGTERFTGTFESPGEAGIDVAGGKARDLSAALTAFIAGQGVEVISNPLNAAPFETVLIMCAMPASATLGTSAVTHAMQEAAAEVMRVILAAAIKDAKADASSGENVVVNFRVPPEFMASVNFEKNSTMALGRMRATVTCESAPEASYLLGSVNGMPKPFSLGYQLPLVEMFYGDNRIRWKDRRSPDCEALIEVVGGVA